MSEQESHLSDTTAFEAALAGLTPRVGGFDRERLIFLAGQAAALREARPSRRGRWAWPTAFAAMTAVAASLMVMLCLRVEPKVAMHGVEPKSEAANISGTRPATGHPVPDTLTDDMPPWLAPWLSPWSAAESPVGNPAEAADATFPESDPALRAELRRRGIDLRRPLRPTVGKTTVVAEGPLPYHELLSRLQSTEPAGQGRGGAMMP